MEITRSIGYVQIYFGIFLVISGITAGVFSGLLHNQIEHRREGFDTYGMVSADAEKFGVTNESVDYRLLELSYGNYLNTFQYNAVFAEYNMFIQLLLGMLILLGIGSQMTFQGIVNTRKGDLKDIHEKKKLLQNIWLAFIIAASFAIFIGMALWL